MLSWDQLHPEQRAMLAALDGDPDIAKAEYEAWREGLHERAQQAVDELLDAMNRCKATGDVEGFTSAVAKLKKMPQYTE